MLDLRFMLYGSDTVYGVLLLVLVLRTSLGMLKYVFLSILRAFFLGKWDVRSDRLVFISAIFVYLFFSLFTLLRYYVTSSGGTYLRFVSWNVKGVNDPVKRGRIFSHLKYL